MAKTLQTLQNRETTGGSCPNCAAECGTDASFCSECGTAVPETATLSAVPAVVPAQRRRKPAAASLETTVLPLPLHLPAPLPSPPPPVPERAPAAQDQASRRPRRRVVALVAAGLLVTGAFVALGLDDRQTHQRLDKTRQALQDSESKLSETRTELAGAQATLAATVTELTGTKTDLESTAATLAATKKQLAAKEQDLQGVRNNLADVKSSVTIQAGQIETLKSCLNGVSIALSDIAYGDYSGAVSALQAVEVSCDKAYALF